MVIDAVQPKIEQYIYIDADFDSFMKKNKKTKKR